MRSNTNVNAIVTVQPYSDFIRSAASHDIVSGVRLNTVMPLRKNPEEIAEVLKRIRDESDGKDVWIDLKGRQLRTEGYAVPPFGAIRLSHKISVNTPVTAYFSNGSNYGTIVAVDGYDIILKDGPQRIVGPGESVNIVDPSLSIEGYLTDTDKKYLEAGLRLGFNKYMLSFVESKDDIGNIANLAQDMELVAKIESQKGLDYVIKDYEQKHARLMAARGDLYMEVKRPHNIIGAVSSIVAKDNRAIVASRIFDSLAYSSEPTCADIGDVDNLLRIGYRSFMFGDEICLRKESILSGLNLLEAISEKYS
jgi:pyruvate kinase